MTIESQNDLEGLLRIGKILGKALRMLIAIVEPGMTTAELDELARVLLENHGARPAPQLAYNFPGTACISLNDEAAHGIPGPRAIHPGDLVNIDLSAELDGYYADTAASVPVPPVSPERRRLCEFARKAQRAGMAAARAGRPVFAIGKAAELEARQGGFTVIRNLPGHGVGRGLHEKPSIPGHFWPLANQPLTEGLVITVEPFLTTGADHVVDGDDGWTLKTPDGSLCAQFEHTLVVTRGRPIVVTAE
jgi:methionyl aminopeptidase